MLQFGVRRAGPLTASCQPTDRLGDKRLPSPFLRRRPRGLLWFWTIGLALAALVFWTTRKLPALEDLLRPAYWVIAAALVIFTARWFRPRDGERRQAERRHEERREDRDATG